MHRCGMHITPKFAEKARYKCLLKIKVTATTTTMYRIAAISHFLLSITFTTNSNIHALYITCHAFAICYSLLIRTQFLQAYGELCLSSIYLGFSQFESEIMLKACLISKLISYSDIAFDMNTVRVTSMTM